MSKNAAKEVTLGKLHDTLATILCKVLDRHNQILDALATLDPEDIQQEVLKELMEGGWEPNPALINAVSKFLKDNEIMYSVEELGELSALQKRLAEKRKSRGNVVSIDTLKVSNE